MPRLYRQAPLNSIWEGSGNVQCLDVLRALSKEPETREAFFGELLAARGAHADLDREVHWLTQAFDDRATLELRSRTIVERMRSEERRVGKGCVGTCRSRWSP